MAGDDAPASRASQPEIPALLLVTPIFLFLFNLFRQDSTTIRLNPGHWPQTDC